MRPLGPRQRETLALIEECRGWVYFMPGVDPGAFVSTGRGAVMIPLRMVWSLEERGLLEPVHHPRLDGQGPLDGWRLKVETPPADGPEMTGA
jgi:hypothetical protein